MKGKPLRGRPLRGRRLIDTEPGMPRAAPAPTGGSGVPANAMLFEDGTPMLFEDGSYMLFE